jgi:aspartyl protease family protein
MKAVAILGAVAVSGVLFAARMPAEPVAAPAEASRYTTKANPWLKDDVQVAQKDNWNAAEVSLSRQGDGHYYADVKVGGIPAQMLVDTGASVVALTGADAKTMGINWTPDQVVPIAQGSSGPVLGLPVTLDRVQVGSIEVQGVQAIVVPDGLGVSLLGQSFLGRLKHVDISGDKMVLGE